PVVGIPLQSVEPAPSAPIVSVPMPSVPAAPQSLPAVPIEPGPAVVTPQVVLSPPRILSHREFAAAFQPAAGSYEVDLIHPGSCKPVHVCFTLPPGCPRVGVAHRGLVFDYGNCAVHIRFDVLGRVRVKYRH